MGDLAAQAQQPGRRRLVQGGQGSHHPTVNQEGHHHAGLERAHHVATGQVATGEHLGPAAGHGAGHGGGDALAVEAVYVVGRYHPFGVGHDQPQRAEKGAQVWNGPLD